MFKTVVQFSLTFLLLIAGLGVMGVIAAALIAGTLRVLIGQLVITHQIGFEFPKFSNLRSYLKFSLPLAPTPVMKWISDSSDRYLVGFFLGVATVGIYSAGYAIGNLIVLLTASLQFILYPALIRLYDEGRLENVRSYLSHALRLFLMVAIPAVFGLSILAEPLLRLVTNSEFTSGSVVVPFVAVSSLLAGVFQILINITYLVDKTRLNAYLLLASGAVNIAINLVLIPTIGMVGAAFATLISFITMVILTAMITSRYITFKICWGFIGKSVASSSVMALLILWMSPQDLFGIALAAGIGAATYFALLAAVKGVSMREVNLVRSIFAQ
jgi:O-antigen/teichoic acid export membrane protein